MSRRGKKLLVIILILWIGMMQTSKVEAALQSNGGTPLKANLNDWIYYTRKMQEAGGTLGLTDTINEDLTSNNKDLDIHMEKNTEYGAMVILSASSYGNPNKITDGQTTTGNASGIVMKLNKEWVAAEVKDKDTWAEKVRNAVGRYKNQYSAPQYTEKAGDAIAVVGNWHGSGATTWMSSHTNSSGTLARCGLLRSYVGSVFSYYGRCYGPTGSAADSDISVSREDADYRKMWSSRAAIVVGSGI